MASLGTDSGKSLPDVDEDDGVGSARTVERKNSTDRKQPTTPRSKHSVSEQRRRGKINDRFEILKEMLPQNDQKRDKASFLLEVIEYIRFLHEKVKNYEAGPEWNQENAKQIPWKPADISSDNPYVPKNSGQSPVYIYSGKFENNNVSVAPAVLPNEQNPKESELGAGTPYQGIENPGISSKDLATLAPMKTSFPASTEGIAGITQLEADRANVASQSQSHWIRSSCLADCTTRSGTLNENEELAIDEGTIHVSSAYSQELFTTLTRALQSSGVDLSQATLSVQINLGKRAVRRSAATTTISNAKDHGDPLDANQAMGNSTAGSSGEDSEPSPKRHKSDSS